MTPAGSCMPPAPVGGDPDDIEALVAASGSRLTVVPR